MVARMKKRFRVNMRRRRRWVWKRRVAIDVAAVGARQRVGTEWHGVAVRQHRAPGTNVMKLYCANTLAMGK